MGIFKQLSSDFNTGREVASMEASQRRMLKSGSIRLKEPSTGRIVEIEVTEKRFPEIFIRSLKNFSKIMESWGAECEFVDPNILKMTFPNGKMAESVRQGLRN